jgi:hypothetical protein
MRRDLGRVFRSPVGTMANWACALKVLGNEAEERLLIEAVGGG